MSSKGTNETKAKGPVKKVKVKRDVEENKEGIRAFLQPKKELGKPKKGR
jgi:hypothetical protein